MYMSSDKSKWEHKIKFYKAMFPLKTNGMSDDQILDTLAKNEQAREKYKELHEDWQTLARKYSNTHPPSYDEDEYLTEEALDKLVEQQTGGRRKHSLRRRYSRRRPRRQSRSRK